MKFAIRQSSFLNVIQTVSKAVAVRTTKQVLTGILLEAKDNALTATAYDLELGIQDTITASEDNGLVIEQTGSIVLPARYLNDVIRKLPSSDVHIAVNTSYMTEIKSGQAEFHLHGIDAAEFPKLPVFHRSQSLSMPSDLLKELIRTTAFAASTLEVRPVLTGIHFQFKAPQLTFTATDALRLATRTATIESAPDSQQWTAILPGKSVQELAKILPDDASPVTIQFTDSHSLFEIGSTLFYTRLIDGAYPDTSRIIPTGHRTDVILDSGLIQDAIDRAALIARDREVRMEVTGSHITLTSSSPDVGNVSESLELSSHSGEDLFISFNAKYVLDALKVVDGDVSIRFNGSNQPFVIVELHNENGLQLISPVLMR